MKIKTLGERHDALKVLDDLEKEIEDQKQVCERDMSPARKQVELQQLQHLECRLIFERQEPL